ncbi:L-fucose kinase [Seminavis robusta]|uniref:L-fucose kinase n=1 Tax=Seminavis robusta TaxID=568900 RepID=A0A9N8EV63_9STRA|nr:L-fucose kinase [Seminavis robusta]|eukprot:Sro1918_g305400.1 L-fucose kinase (1353) ;mRNA; f:12786-16844
MGTMEEQHRTSSSNCGGSDTSSRGVSSPTASPTRRHRNKASMDVYPFAVVVVTFPDEGAARVATTGPLQELQETYPTTKFLATCDPLGCRCGSGGGTLAALEASGDDPDATILILHAGGDSSRCFTQMALGKAWTNLPLLDDRLGKEILSNPILLCMDSVARIFSQSHRLPKGSVVIAASDCLLSIPHYYKKGKSTRELGTSLNMNGNGNNGGDDDQHPKLPDVLGVAFPAAWETAKNHGVYVLAEPPACSTLEEANQRECEVPIRRVFQKPSIETLQAQPFVTFGNVPTDATGLAWIDNGIIAFLPKAARTLYDLARGILKTTTKPGLLAAMKEQEEKGNKVVSYQDLTQKVDLYTHFLQALTIVGEPGQELSQEQHRANYLKDHASDLDQTVANGIFDALSPFQFQALAVPEGKFLHLGTTRELIDFYVHGCKTTKHHHHQTAEEQQSVQQSAAKPTRHELYTQNCTFFGQELGLIRRLDLFIKWKDSQGSNSNNKNDCISKNCIIMGSVLEGSSVSSIGEGSVIEFCNLDSSANPGLSIQIGKDCLVSGLRHLEGSPIMADSTFRIPSETCMQMMPVVPSEDANVESSSFVVMALGVNDPIKNNLAESTLFGVEMEVFLNWANLTPDDIWPADEKRTVWNAKLHPVISSNTKKSFSSVWEWVNHLPNNSQDTLPETAKASLQSWKETTRLSLRQMRNQSDADKEFQYRRDLVNKVVPQKRQQHCQSIIDILWGRQHDECNFYPLLADTLKVEKEDSTMQFVSSPATEAVRSLDDVISGALLDQHHYDVCGRTLMVQSALLANLAEATFREGAIEENEKAMITAEIRKHCNTFLEVIQSHNASGADREKAYTEVVAIRKKFIKANEGAIGVKTVLKEFSDIMEEIARIMTAICVSGFLNDNAALKGNSDRLPPVVGQWVIATSPARVDLSGGWSDTPPICYEFGSAVTGIAVTVDKKKPLSSRCRIVPREASSDSAPIILVRSELRDSRKCDLVSSIDTEIREMKDLKDARDPSASGALVKCALVCLGLISLEQLQASQGEADAPSLQDRVNEFCQSHNGDVVMEIAVTSLLPQGSGMGTSSILGGCVLAAVGQCVGIKHTTTGDESDSSGNIIDSVSALEQILSTGGGFQDQVNGLIGGAKIVSTKPCELPIRLSIQQVEVAPSVQKNLDDRLLLAFTGKTRLAANILQNVLRRFALRTPEIVDCANRLVDGAHKARDALQKGDIDAVAECLHSYWKQKKHMAGDDVGVEPEAVRLIMEELKQQGLISGASLCGAGGGGFLVMIASADAETSKIDSAVQQCLGCSSDPDSASAFSWHECNISNVGLITTVLSSEETGMVADFEASWHSC